MIEKYSSLEHIRKRPRMYIGSLKHVGFNELISYLIQDFIENGIQEVTILLRENNELIIEGISTGKTTFISDAIENIKGYKSKPFCLSLACIIALADFAIIELDNISILKSNKGVPEIAEEVNKYDFNKVKINFRPDLEVFSGLILNYENLNNLLRQFSFLDSRLTIKSIDESKMEKQINFFHYPNGLAEILDLELEKRPEYDSAFFKLNFLKNTEFSYSLALAFVGGWNLKPKIKVYANYKETVLGGSLLDGIFEGFKKFLKEESSKRNLNINVGNAKLKKHLYFYASVRGDLKYLGSTRWKLGTPKVKTEIKEYVYEELKSLFKGKEDKITEMLEVLLNKM